VSSLGTIEIIDLLDTPLSIDLLDQWCAQWFPCQIDDAPQKWEVYS